jgi:hypothetical protein
MQQTNKTNAPVDYKLSTIFYFGSLEIQDHLEIFTITKNESYQQQHVKKKLISSETSQTKKTNESSKITLSFQIQTKNHTRPATESFPQRLPSSVHLELHMGKLRTSS